MTAPTEARAELIKANADVEAAAEVLARAKAATAAARELQAGVDGELAALKADRDHIADVQGLGIAESIKAGLAPEIKSVAAAAKNAAAVAGAQGRHAACQRAVEQLEAEERLLAADLVSAEARVAVEIRNVLIGEADLMAARVRELETEALRLRLNLGFESSFIARLAPGRFSSALAPELETNSRPFLEARASSAVWAAFAKALSENAEACLSFQK